MTSLARYATDLELVCQEIDNADGVISDELMARFDDAKLALSDKADRWINYLDMLKGMAETLKERKDRAAKAQKTAEALQKRLREYVKFVIEQNPGIPFVGTEGRITLQNKAEGVAYAFAIPDKTFYRVCDKTSLELEPSLLPYIQVSSVMTVDHDKVKADLKAGMQLRFATLTRGSSIRIR